MLYELIKKIVVEKRPYPCNYCEGGWGKQDTDGKVSTCHESCDLYKAWWNGELVVPPGFDEVKEIKAI